MAEHIQKDFGITIDGYPFIKKFTAKLEYSTSTFIQKFLTNTQRCGGSFRFKFDIITGQITLISTSFQRSAMSVIHERLEVDPKQYLFDYLSYQLINSGVLPSLTDIPLGGAPSPPRKKSSKSKSPSKSNAPKKVIIITLSGASSSRTDATFHYDRDALFTMFQYFKGDKSQIFGTELLLGYENAEEKPNTYMDKDTRSYNPENVGQRISDLHNKMTAIHSKINKPVVLRGIYNQGDTLVFANTLLKHAVITPSEIVNLGEKTMSIDIEAPEEMVKGMPVRKKFKTEVKICQHRQETGKNHLLNRQLIGVGVSIANEESIPKDGVDDIEYIPIGVLVAGEPIPVNIVDFDEAKYAEFIEILNEEKDSCFKIKGVDALSEIDLSNRGGKSVRNRRRRKNKRTRKRRNL